MGIILGELYYFYDSRCIAPQHIFLKVWKEDISKNITKEINYYPQLFKNLKVLHISESSLPDWRIEKSAITAKREGYDVFFAGQKKREDYLNDIFNKIYEIEINITAKYKFPFYYQIVKKKINNIIKEIRPDIIHAHNIFCGKIATEFDIPFVFDDHEYSSMYGKIVHETFKTLESQATSTSNKIRWCIRKNIKAYMSNLWTK